MNDLIDRLLEHLWLNDRLSQNTLEGYRRDLSKIGQRLQHAGKDWLSAEPADLADAVYAAEESSRSQARALSALKRLYGWLLDSGQLAANPTERLGERIELPKNRELAEFAQAFNDMLAAAAEAPTPDSAPADAEAALAFDLDELLMLDPPAVLADEAPAAPDAGVRSRRDSARDSRCQHRAAPEQRERGPGQRRRARAEPAQPRHGLGHGKHVRHGHGHGQKRRRGRRQRRPRSRQGR